MGAEAEWEHLKEVLDREVMACVPLKRRKNGGRPWWMTRKVMKMIRKKRRMWRVYTADPRAKHDFDQYQAYKKIQKDVQAAGKNAKRNY